MTRRSALLSTTLFFLLAAGANPARADYMNWTYTTTTTLPVMSSSTTLSQVQLTGVVSGPAGSPIPLLGIQESSTATSGNPDVFNHTPFTLGVTFTDTTTSDSATLTLNGTLNGTLSATTSSLVATFNGAHSIKLDGHEYVLNLPALHISAPDTPQQFLTATIHVNNPGHDPGPPSTNPGGGVQGAPEPTSLVLGGLGCTLLSLGGLWKGRRRRTSPSA